MFTQWLEIYHHNQYINSVFAEETSTFNFCLNLKGFLEIRHESHTCWFCPQITLAKLETFFAKVQIAFKSLCSRSSLLFLNEKYKTSYKTLVVVNVFYKYLWFTEQSLKLFFHIQIGKVSPLALGEGSRCRILRPPQHDGPRCRDRVCGVGLHGFPHVCVPSCDTGEILWIQR